LKPECYNYLQIKEYLQLVKKNVNYLPFLRRTPYSALAAWFKTDEGMDVYKAMTKKEKQIKK